MAMSDLLGVIFMTVFISLTIFAIIYRGYLTDLKDPMYNKAKYIYNHSWTSTGYSIRSLVRTSGGEEYIFEDSLDISLPFFILIDGRKLNTQSIETIKEYVVNHYLVPVNDYDCINVVVIDDYMYILQEDKKGRKELYELFDGEIIHVDEGLFSLPGMLNLGDFYNKEEREEKRNTWSRVIHPKQF